MAAFEVPKPTGGDVAAGISVGLILIPQALAYAVLAGVPPQRGLIVAVIATLAAAPLASSPFLQTGPVAITALLTFGALESISRPGSPEYVELTILLALLVGIIRIAIGALGEGGIAYLMSQPVLIGFAPAAGLVIVESQIDSALDVASPGGPVTAAAIEILRSPSDWSLEALAITIITIVVVNGARRLHPLLPGVLIAVVAGLLYSALTDYAGSVLGTFPITVFAPDLTLPWSKLPELVVPAAVIAIVGFADSAAVARLYATETRTPWNPDREFLAQGVANVASAIAGGFPAGGSFSRSAVNRLAGAKTIWSGAITGALVLAFTPFSNVLARLPVAVLAGIIIASVLGLLRPQPLLELRGFSRIQFLIAGFTFVMTLLLAPRIQWALIIGISLAIGWHLRREVLIDVDEEVRGLELHLRPRGVLYFASAHEIERHFTDRLATNPEVGRLVLHCGALGRVDISGALVLRQLAVDAVSAGIEVDVRELTAASRKILLRVLGNVPGVRIG